MRTKSKLCRPWIKAQVVSIVMLVMVGLGFQSSILFSGRHWLHEHARGILPNVIFLEEIYWTVSATQASSVPSIVSEKEASLPPAKGASVSLQKPKETPNKKGRLEEPKETSSKKERLKEPKETPSKKGSLEEPKETPSKKGSLEEPKETPSKKGSLEEPKETPSKKGSLEEPKETPSKKENLEEPKERPSKKESLEEPKDTPSKKGSLEEPKDTPSKKGSLEEPKETPSKKGRPEEPDWTEDMNIRNCTRERDPLRLKIRENVPIRSIQEMTQMLLRNQRSSCLKGPEWASPIDQDILQARREILSAPFVDDDPELYPPIYRNFSTFKRSYELMEKMLKVYVYKEGERPIFNEPPLTGIYSAEGWFMKHMEESVRFLVDDPAKAHIFYMPFSSSVLRTKLYDPVIRDKEILYNHLRSYVSTISGKYPFWNRTAGTDHFSVACHDWAASFKEKAMGDSVMATCNADITGAFELGKDVSITLTAVRNSQNPLKNAGGLPAWKRDTLAFFAGQMHGDVRPLIFDYWGDNKDSDIQAFKIVDGNLRSYVERMKSSKFCLCPSGYVPNSPRLAESFFYECVPVIISDNFVPPFFDILHWEAFSIALPEKDIPRLKEILMAVTPAQYSALHHGVKMVRRHFLWHIKPERFDLFHMTLHSLWFNRVLQFREHTGEKLAEI